MKPQDSHEYPPFFAAFLLAIRWLKKKTPAKRRKISWSQKNNYIFGDQSIIERPGFPRVFWKNYTPCFPFWTLLNCPFRKF